MFLGLEKQLLKAALLMSLIGLGGLIVLTNVEKELIPLGALETSKEGGLVKTLGTVKQVKNLPGMVLFVLQDKEVEMQVVFYGKVDIEKESAIIVEGRVKEYKGKKEIIAEKIIKK